jgi:hypothetical protein
MFNVKITSDFTFSLILVLESCEILLFLLLVIILLLWVNLVVLLRYYYYSCTVYYYYFCVAAWERTPQAPLKGLWMCSLYLPFVWWRTHRNRLKVGKIPPPRVWCKNRQKLLSRCFFPLHVEKTTGKFSSNRKTLWYFLLE